MNATSSDARIHRAGQVVLTHWAGILLSALGVCELLLAVGARPALTLVLGVVGGCALVAAPWVRGRPRTVGVLLVVGAVPFAVATWWSLVTPLLAMLAVGLGIAVLRGSSRRPHAA